MRAAIEEFIALGEARFRANLIAFLRDIIPLLPQAASICVHPDDPVFALWPARVVSTAADARNLQRCTQPQWL